MLQYVHDTQDYACHKHACMYIIIQIIYHFCFSAIYKHYDGVILPEIKDQKRFSVNANFGLGAIVKSKFLGLIKPKSSTPSSDEQLLSNSHHIELRKNALTFYLNSWCNILCGPESMDDPVNVVQTVHAIFTTLNDSSVICNWSEMDFRLPETTDVS